jgi:hypothetical protein
MKTPAWRPLFVLSLVCLISACAVREGKTSIYADYDPGTSFTDYRTFAWMTQNPLVASTPDVVNPNLQTNLMAETAAQLKNKGFRQVSTPGEADIVVAFTIGARDSLQENNFPGRYRQIGTVGQTYGESSEIREITTGALSIEIFDQASARRLWTGYATTGVTMDVRINSQAETKELVAMIMDQFPPNG